MFRHVYDGYISRNEKIVRNKWKVMNFKGIFRVRINELNRQWLRAMISVIIELIGRLWTENAAGECRCEIMGKCKFRGRRTRGQGLISHFADRIWAPYFIRVITPTHPSSSTIILITVQPSVVKRNVRYLLEQLWKLQSLRWSSQLFNYLWFHYEEFRIPRRISKSPNSVDFLLALTVALNLEIPTTFSTPRKLPSPWNIKIAQFYWFSQLLLIPALKLETPRTFWIPYKQ